MDVTFSLRKFPAKEFLKNHFNSRKENYMDFLAPLIVVAVIVASIFTGAFIGVTIYQLQCKRSSRGQLYIYVDHSNKDESAKMYIDLNNVTPDEIAKERLVTFEVVNVS